MVTNATELAKRLLHWAAFGYGVEASRDMTQAGTLIEQQAAQIKDLEADRDSWRDQASQRVADWAAMKAERDALKARVEAVEGVLQAIPSTSGAMIDFIGSNFNSMEAQGWTDSVLPKPTGDLGMVKYTLTVHDLLSAFSWAGLDAESIDAAIATQGGKEGA